MLIQVQIEAFHMLVARFGQNVVPSLAHGELKDSLVRPKALSTWHAKCSQPLRFPRISPICLEPGI
jgi:hypothetical protein